ncbi:GNAT family N-acetyltransferase [Aidingimonas halophila]|uniref:Ribosomal protein S18 acetylase RimI n=1 Tax=Aidingimonas halophila TaxID=574349 RepID=A0A1H3F0N7_9GAMM|nr:GNAT family N-acetyltransferase [Aidingimonas halophila]GHC32133.1 hypothetical protein GCM10008094_26040 [Aidingimonas halophila]SDX84583.1 Ribosomal protein S18 acetylase RimI [Aidingimonas halophila]
MTIHLRYAYPADLDEMYRLERCCFDEDAFNRRQLMHMLARANASVWIAMGDLEEALGYAIILYRRNSRVARLYSFCVVPEVRRRGVGRRLIEAVECDAARRQCDRLVLEVRADNRAALALYRRTGFLLRRWLDDYYADGCAAWQMDKPISRETTIAG